MHRSPNQHRLAPSVNPLRITSRFVLYVVLRAVCGVSFVVFTDARLHAYTQQLFNALFEDAHKTQIQLQIPNLELRAQTRAATKQLLVRLYQQCVEKYVRVVVAIAVGAVLYV